MLSACVTSDAKRVTCFTPYLLSGLVLPVSYTHLRAHETSHHLVCRLLLEKIFLMIRRPPRSTQVLSSAASDVYKRQVEVAIMLSACVTSDAKRVTCFTPYLLSGLVLLMNSGPALAQIFFRRPPTKVSIHNPSSTEGQRNRTTISVLVPKDSGAEPVSYTHLTLPTTTPV